MVFSRRERVWMELFPQLFQRSQRFLEMGRMRPLRERVKVRWRLRVLKT